MYTREKTVQALKRNGRQQMACVLDKCWHSPIGEYSRKLYTPEAGTALEPQLLEAFATEFERLGHLPAVVEATTSSLQRTGVLQTATHLTLSEGPTFLAVHQLASYGVPAGEYYIVAAFSGIPFSNSAWPGCFNYSNRYAVDDLLQETCPGFRDLLRAERDRKRDTADMRVSTISGKLRDARVYRTQLPDRLRQLLPHLTPKLANIAPEAGTSQSFSAWALGSAENQMNQLMPSKRVVYLDINEVVACYLAKTVTIPEHPIHRLFFDVEIQNQVMGVFGAKLPIFSLCVQHRKRWKQENMYFEGGNLHSGMERLKLTEESLCSGLESGRLCPGVFLTFVVLTFLNGLKCLGSFDQLEYLHAFQAGLRKMTWLDQDLVNKATVTGLTSGRCIDGNQKPVFPLDMILGTQWEFSPHQSLGEWIQPLLPRLSKLC